MSASKNLEYEKTSFLNKSNSAFIERMYLKFVNKDADLPDSWKDYFEGIGDELNIIAKEINGPSWGPKKNTVDIDELQKKIDQEEQNSNGITINNNGVSPGSSRSNEDSIKAVSMIRSYRQRGHLIAIRCPRCLYDLIIETALIESSLDLDEPGLTPLLFIVIPLEFCSSWSIFF